jgi:quinol monooxygenase YgiN
MWMQITKIKTDPDKVDELMALIRNDEVVGAAITTGKGQTSYVLRSTKDPGEIVSITVWEDEESSVAFFTSAAYAKLGQQMRPYLIAPPERAGYEIKRMGQAYAGAVLRYP